MEDDSTFTMDVLATGPCTPSPDVSTFCLVRAGALMKRCVPSKCDVKDVAISNGCVTHVDTGMCSWTSLGVTCLVEDSHDVNREVSPFFMVAIDRFRAPGQTCFGF